eukprot:2148668-Prymnesium_polylepis.1
MCIRDSIYDSAESASASAKCLTSATSSTTSTSTTSAEPAAAAAITPPTEPSGTATRAHLPVDSRAVEPQLRVPLLLGCGRDSAEPLQAVLPG